MDCFAPYLPTLPTPLKRFVIMDCVVCCYGFPYAFMEALPENELFQYYMGIGAMVALRDTPKGQLLAQVASMSEAEARNAYMLLNGHERQ